MNNSGPKPPPLNFALISSSIGSTSFVCMLCNAIIIFCYVRSKKLKNKCYVLIVNLAVADMLVGLSFVHTMARRFSCLGMRWTSCAGNQIQCVLQVFPLYFSTDVSMIFSLALAVDRILCVKRPIWYRISEKKIWWRASIVCWLAVLAIEVPMFIGLDPRKRFFVCAVQSVQPSYYEFSITFGLLTTVVTLALYVTFIVIERNRKVG